MLPFNQKNISKSISLNTIFLEDVHLTYNVSEKNDITVNSSPYLDNKVILKVKKQADIYTFIEKIKEFNSIYQQKTNTVNIEGEGSTRFTVYTLIINNVQYGNEAYKVPKLIATFRKKGGNGEVITSISVSTYIKSLTIKEPNKNYSQDELINKELTVELDILSSPYYQTLMGFKNSRNSTNQPYTQHNFNFDFKELSFSHLDEETVEVFFGMPSTVTKDLFDKVNKESIRIVPTYPLYDGNYCIYMGDVIYIKDKGYLAYFKGNPPNKEYLNQDSATLGNYISSDFGNIYLKATPFEGEAIKRNCIPLVGQLITINKETFPLLSMYAASNDLPADYFTQLVTDQYKVVDLRNLLIPQELRSKITPMMVVE